MKRQISTILIMGLMLAAAVTATAQTWNTLGAAVEWPLDNRSAMLFTGPNYRDYIVPTRQIMGLRSISDIGGHNFRDWNSIDAATQFNGSIYLFLGSEYVRLGVGLGASRGQRMKIAGNFAGNWPGGWTYVDAAVNLGNGIVYFFHSRDYIRYNISSGKVENDPTPIVGNFAVTWPNWNYVDAALNLRNGKVAFFKGDQYFLYTISTAKTEAPVPVIPNFGNWYSPPVNTASVEKPEGPRQWPNSRICASEGTVCRVNGTQQVAYGYNRSSGYVFKTVNGSITCNTRNFGRDPAPGKVKACYVQTN